MRTLPVELAVTLRHRATLAYDSALDGDGLCDTSWVCVALHAAQDLASAGLQLKELEASSAEQIRLLGESLQAELEALPELFEAWCQMERDRGLLSGRGETP